jgi:hypothetical protein
MLVALVRGMHFSTNDNLLHEREILEA